MPAPSPAASASAPPGTGTIPPGWSDHDVEARDKIRRYVGDLAPAFKDIYPAPVFLKLAAILGVEDDYPALHQKPAFAQVPQLVLNDALTPLTPEVVDGVKVFKLTIDEMEAQDRRAPAARRGSRLQQVVAGSDHPRHRGRQGPRRFHQQPQGDDRASTSTASTSTTSSRMASRS